jgi:hypothetical protein
VKRLLGLFWDRVAAVTCVVVAVVTLIVGWVQVSAESQAGDQIPYVMSAGIGGLFLLAVGLTLWLSADLRDEWRKLDVIDENLRRLAGDPAPADEGETISLSDDALPGGPGVSPGVKGALPRPAGARQ